MDRSHSLEPSGPRASAPAAPLGLASIVLPVFAGAAVVPVSSQSGGDPLAAAAWIATAAAAAGATIAAFVAALSVGRERRVLRVAAVFALPLLLIGWAGLAGHGSGWGPMGPLPDPLRAACAASGLFLLGASLAPWGGVRAGHRSGAMIAVGSSRAGALLLVAMAADGAAAGWGLLEPRPPWAPEVAARLLDLSPRALVLESGGADWMRHDSVYGPVGTDRLGPGIRTGWGGSVAAYLALVVGCACAALRCGVRFR